VIHDSISYDPIQGSRHGGLKCAKMADDFKAYLLHWHALNQQTNIGVWYCKTISKICWGYRSGSPTAIEAWQPCPLWEPSPSHPILL